MNPVLLFPFLSTVHMQRRRFLATRLYQLKVSLCSSNVKIAKLQVSIFQLWVKIILFNQDSSVSYKIPGQNESFGYFNIIQVGGIIQRRRDFSIKVKIVESCWYIPVRSRYSSQVKKYKLDHDFPVSHPATRNPT